MTKQLSQVIASRFNHQPALLSSAHADMFVDALRYMAEADDEDEQTQSEMRRSEMLAAYGFGPDSEEKPFVYSNGLAFIPVTGLLINRFTASYGWLTGYNFIRSWLQAALNDSDVKGIVLDCNSPGGEVAGCFELAAEIRAARDVKPIIAVVDSMSYSACYAISSAATKIIAIPSGGVGSIGAVAMHVDFSRMLSDAGIKITFIYSGDHKVDGNPYEPLPEPVRNSIQTRVNSSRQKFATLVSSNRGLDEKVVFDTQAECYSAEDALSIGLIDAIATPFEAVRAFFNELSGSDPDQEIAMSTAANSPGAETTAAAPEANAAQTTEAAATETKVDLAAERAAERERIAAITSHESAKGRASLANHLALKTNLPVDEAAAILAAASTEAKNESASAFFDAMDASIHPKVGADVAGETGELSLAQQIIRSQAQATGVKH